MLGRVRGFVFWLRGLSEGTNRARTHLELNPWLGSGLDFGKTWRALTMTFGTLLVIILLFAAIGAFPQWPHSAGWGYWPSGLIALALVVVVLLVLAAGSL